MKPLSSSQRVMPSMASMLPGAAESDCLATRSLAGTRCSAALTVVSRSDGRSRPLTRASRDSAVMRCATNAGMRRDAVIGQAVPGRETAATSRSGAKKPSARASAAMRGPSRQTTTRLVAGASARGRDGAGEIGDHKPFGAVGDAGERERAAGGQEFGRECAPCLSLRSRRVVEIAQPAEQRRCRGPPAPRLRR